MECSYTGNFYEVHRAKKRRMIGPAQSKAITAMINDGRSSESFRETEAVRLMKIGRYLILILEYYCIILKILKIFVLSKNLKM